MRNGMKWLIPMILAGLLAGCGSSDDPVAVDGRTVKLYGTTVGNSSLGESILVELSPDNGSLLRTIGAVGYYVNGLKYDPAHHKLYGTTSSNDPVFPDGLIEIDRATGAGTPIGTGAGMPVSTPAVSSSGALFAVDQSDSDLVTVDITTGVATAVGNPGFSPYRHGLAFDNTGNLLLVNGDGEIYTIDPLSGVGTYTASIGQMAHHGDVHPTTGAYWGIDETWETAPGPDGPRNLLAVDVTAGTIDATLPTVGDLHAIAFCHDDPVAVRVRTVKLYGTTFGNDTLGDSVLVELSPEDGSLLRTIGQVGYYVNGLEYDAVHHKLYGTTSTNDPVFPDGLIEIDRSTGAGTPVGAGAGMMIMNPTVNAMGRMFAWTEDSDDLVTVDTATGAATVVGDSGVSSYEHGLAFGANDNLVLVNGELGDIYAIDPVSGVGTYVSTIGQRAHHGDFHPVTGQYWGIDQTWAYVPGPGGARNLLVVDVAAGTVTTTLPTRDDLHAITFFYD